MPALAVRRLLAQRGMGEDISAAITQFDKLFQTWLAAADYRHAREMAMFYIDLKPRVSLAFRVAQINATLQKEPEDLALLHRASILQQETRDN